MATIELEGQNLQDFINEVTSRLQSRISERDELLKTKETLVKTRDNAQLAIDQIDVKIANKDEQIINNQTILGI